MTVPCSEEVCSISQKYTPLTVVLQSKVSFKNNVYTSTEMTVFNSGDLLYSNDV